MKWWWCLCVPSVVWAGELIEINSAGVSDAEQEPQARDQITREVAEKTAERYILELIGAKKAQDNPQAVQSIVKQSSKYFPFIKAGDLSREQDHYQMSVNLRLSLDDLKQLLSKEGLLQEAELGAVALPLIAVEDSEGFRYSWWVEADAKASLAGTAKKLEKALRDEFRASGFFVLKPASSGIFEITPPPYRQDTLSLSEAGSLAELFRAQMVITGKLTLAPERKMTLKVAVYQAQNARFVTELVRSGEADLLAQASKQLASQVLEAWRKGKFETEQLKLSINGELSPQQLDSFKGSLSKTLPQVRAFRERLFEAGHVVYELDATGSVGDLAARLKATSVPGLEMSVSEVGVDQIQVDVKSR